MKRIILTERDEKIIEFLNTFKVATTSTIATIFFNSSKRPCTRRLKHLREHGFIKSSQEFVCLEQIHYINKKPTQLKHSTIVTNFISKLYENNVEILKCKSEFKIGNVRCDLLVVFRLNNNVVIYFVEVCNTKPFDINKYINLYKSNKWKEYFPVFPKILSISDKEIEENSNLNINKCSLNLEDLKIE